MNVVLSGRYEVWLAPGREERPSLHVSVTRSVSEEFSVLELRDGVFQLRAHWSLVGSATQALQALGEARLCLQAFAMMRNDHNELCQVPAGAARVALAELVGARRGKGQWLRVELLFPMFDRRQPEAHKGYVVFELAQCDMRIGGRSVRELVPDAQWRVPRLQYSPLEQYIESQEQQFGPTGMRSTWQLLDRVNVFRFQSEVGMAPAAAYFDAPLSATGEEYYLNAALLALRMQELTAEQALAWRLDESREDCRFASYWLAALLSMYVQSCDYIGDEVCVRGADGRFRVEPVEWFEQARVRDGSIDCEDAAMETMVEGLELERLRTDQPLLRLAQRIKRAFYVMLLLDGVSAVEINLAQAPRHMAAHMNSALINRAQLRRWSPQLCAEHGPSAEEQRYAALFPPVVMMEGTGPLDPNGVEHGRDDAAGEQALSRALGTEPMLTRALRRVYHYDASGQRQSGFYKVTKVAATGELHARGGCGQFVFVLEPRSSGTAGVSFQQMAAASAEVVAVPQLELTPAQQAVMHAQMLDLHPQPTLLAPSQAPASEQVRRAQQQMRDVVIPAMQALVQPRAPGRPVHELRQDAKYQHFDAAGSFAAALVRALRTAQRDGVLTLVAFRADDYQVTPTRGFYQLVFSLQ